MLGYVCFACLLSYWLSRSLGGSKLVAWRLLGSFSVCSGVRISVLGGCWKVPPGVRDLDIRSLESVGEFLKISGSSQFGMWNLLESTLRVRELHMIVLEALGEPTLLTKKEFCQIPSQY